MKPNLDELQVASDATITEAMAAIDAGAQGIVFVTDPSGVVLGTLSDGDLRRSILSGRTLSDRCLPEAMERNFVSATSDTTRSEALDQMIARNIRHIPVIDDHGRLVGLHLLRQLLGAEERPNWAVIMAGGEGQRLRPITEQIPKPMVKVAGRPVLERLVLHLVGWGIRTVYLSVNYLSEMIEAHFGDGGDFGCSIEYLHEPEPLGTGGSLSLLPERPKHPFIVMNGDLVTQVNIGHLLKHHKTGNFVATIGLHPHRVTIPYGVVRVTEGGVAEISEKPTHEHLINAGIYVLAPELIDRVPRGENFAITRLFAEALSRGEEIGAYVIEDDWIDVGNHRDLSRAQGRNDR